MARSLQQQPRWALTSLPTLSLLLDQCVSYWLRDLVASSHSMILRDYNSLVSSLLCAATVGSYEPATLCEIIAAAATVGFHEPSYSTHLYRCCCIHAFPVWLPELVASSHSMILRAYNSQVSSMLFAATVGSYGSATHWHCRRGCSHSGLLRAYYHWRHSCGSSHGMQLRTLSTRRHHCRCIHAFLVSCVTSLSAATV